MLSNVSEGNQWKELILASMSRQCSLLLVVNHVEVSFDRCEQAMIFAPGGEFVGGFVWQV